MNPNNKYKLLLADDHVLLREALAKLINSFDQFHVIDVAGNGQDVQQSLQNGHKPDLILLDLNMPLMDGYQTAKWLQQNHPDIKILILTMFDSEIALIRLLKAGVKGFLKKDIHPQELRYALTSVAEDGYYYSQQATGKLASLFRSGEGDEFPLSKAILSETEVKFLQLACTDMTYKEIAHVLKLTPRIIDNYRDALFEKLDVKSRVGMAIYAVKHGLVTF